MKRARVDEAVGQQGAFHGWRRGRPGLRWGGCLAGDARAECRICHLVISARSERAGEELRPRVSVQCRSANGASQATCMATSARCTYLHADDREQHLEHDDDADDIGDGGKGLEE